MREDRKTARRRWPAEARQYARRMRAAGMSVASSAQAVALIFSRPCRSSTLFEWVSDLHGIHAANAPWPRRWIRRARHLRLEYGTSMDNIAAIITIESGRSCRRSTVDGWFGNRYPKKKRTG